MYTILEKTGPMFGLSVEFDFDIDGHACYLIRSLADNNYYIEHFSIIVPLSSSIMIFVKDVREELEHLEFDSEYLLSYYETVRNTNMFVSLDVLRNSLKVFSEKVSNFCSYLEGN